MTWKQARYAWLSIMIIEVVIGIFVAWYVFFPLAFIAYLCASLAFVHDPELQQREEDRIDRWYWQVRYEMASKDTIALMRAAELQRERWRRNPWLKTIEKYGSGLAVAGVALLYSLGLSIGRKLRR